MKEGCRACGRGDKQLPTSHGRRQKFAGGVPAICGVHKCARSAPTRGSGGMPPRKIVDFRPPEIVSDAFSEYRAKIPRIMQTAHLALEAYTHSTVMKRDVDYCDLMVMRLM